MRVASVCLLLTGLFCGGPLAAEEPAPPAPPAAPEAPATEADWAKVLHAAALARSAA